jgi:DNA modification methylase
MFKEVDPPAILSNAEKKVNIYQINGKPTVPEDVDNNTPLEELNLNWTEKDLPEKIRTKHVNRLHPYLGKFIPQIVEIFLRKYFLPGQTVLDPFCGSGTTLVQANELGINSIGFDISEFNIMLVNAKTKPYDHIKLKKEAHDLLEKVRQVLDKDDHPNLFSESTDKSFSLKTDNEYLNTWFAPSALREILVFRNLIEEYQNKDLFKIVLSRSARSARLTTHFDLDFPKKPQTEPYYCYKHSRTCYPTTDAFKFLKRYLLDSIKRVEEYSHLRTDAKVSAIHTDSRTATIEPVDGIITSPPYVGLIDYHAQHNYAYNLLGLADNSTKEIGAAKNGSSKKAKEEYKQAMVDVLSNTSNFVKVGGKIIVIAGDRDNLYPEIGERAKLKLESVVERHVNRRTGRRNTEFFESIFIYTK